MSRVNYSILINKAIQKYMLENGHDKNYPIWQLFFNPFFIVDDTSAEICGAIDYKRDNDNDVSYTIRIFNKEKRIFNIENVMNDYLLLYCYDNKIHKIQSRKHYFKNEIDDLFLVCFKKENKMKNLYIYKNEELIVKEENVLKYECSKDFIISYIKSDSVSNSSINKIDIKDMKIEKIASTKSDSNDYDVLNNNIKYFYASYSLFDYENYIKFYISYQETIDFYILFDYAKVHAKKILIIKNDIFNDNSLNYEIWFDREQKEEIEYFFYVSHYKSQQYLYLMGYPLYVIIKYAQYGNSSRKLIISTDDNFRSLFNIIDSIKESLNIYSTNDFIVYMQRKYNNINLCDYTGRKSAYIHFIRPTSYGSRYENYFNQYKKQYMEDKEKIVLDDRYNFRWKSEKKLFRLIKGFFDDAIYQYRNTWLKPQSLDVYIPSLKVGFEYQGLQHYKAIDYFGGEVALLKNQERDKKKLELCKKHDIKIIYWDYDEDINVDLLKQKLENNGYCDINYSFNNNLESNNEINEFMDYKMIDKVNIGDNE